MTDPNQLDELLNKARACTKRGAHQEALSLYEVIVATEPTIEPALLTEIGIAYHQNEQHKQAVTFYGRSLQQTPNAPTTLVLRGTALLTLQRHQAALKDFNEAIRLSPYLDDAYWGRGKAYVGLNDAEWAVASFSRAIELDPDAPEYYEARALARQQLGRMTEANQDRQTANLLRKSG